MAKPAVQAKGSTKGSTKGLTRGRRKPLTERIGAILERWFLGDPLLLSVWTSHAFIAEPRIQSIRVQHGRIEYAPAFLAGLDDRELEQVMRFETLRIVLKHPYARRPDDPRRAYLASNITLQEYLQTTLPFPRAHEVFGHDQYNQQYFEFYYQQLSELPPPAAAGDGASDEGGGDSDQTGNGAAGQSDGQSDAGEPDQGGAGAGTADRPTPLAAYREAGAENTAGWDRNELLAEEINEWIKNARDNARWGSVPGRLRSHILATLQPKLDYRRILRRFRATVLSEQRILTRMRPSRRYGFAYAGSRRTFVTQLLFAVDVSGSIGNDDLALAFSVVNRFFKYGIEAIDVIQFDTEVKDKLLRLKKAKRQVQIIGRGGTNLQPVLDYIDDYPHYDGLIVFTDGYAPIPRPPRNRRTRVLWLFNHEQSYQQRHQALDAIGLTAFLRQDPWLT